MVPSPLFTPHSTSTSRPSSVRWFYYPFPLEGVRGETKRAKRRQERLSVAVAERAVPFAEAESLVLEQVFRDHPATHRVPTAPHMTPQDPSTWARERDAPRDVYGVPKVRSKT